MLGYPGFLFVTEIPRRQQILFNLFWLDALVCMRRPLNDLACSGKYALHEALIVHADFPHLDHYLPKSLSPEDDQLLQQHLRAQDNRFSNALLLLRQTGMRVGELLRLATDCLRHLSAQQWALHVPLGKLHTERLVPVDEQVRHLYARLLLLRQENDFASSCNLLLPYRTGPWAAYRALRVALIKAAQQAGCSQPLALMRNDPGLLTFSDPPAMGGKSTASL
jgi:integrase